MCYDSVATSVQIVFQCSYQVWRYVDGSVEPVAVPGPILDYNGYYPYTFVVPSVTTDSILTLAISSLGSEIINHITYTVAWNSSEQRERITAFCAITIF